MSSALRGGFGPDWECAWGQRPRLGWLPPTRRSLPARIHPCALHPFVTLPPCPSLSALPFTLRCGRRRLGQVRLSLGFNIGENTGFYLIARYVLYPVDGKGGLGGGAGREHDGEHGGKEDERERENLDVHSGAYTHWFP